MHRVVSASLFLCLPVLLCQAGPLHDDDFSGHRQRRDASKWPTLDDRKACPADQHEQPTIRVNTTQRLRDLRAQMEDRGLHAFIVLSDDAHGSEYPSPRDLRRGFISGFTGSAGYAVITRNKAALWTDGRYFLEADDALDCNWIFMRSGETDVPTTSEWMIEEMKDTPNAVIGADPFLVKNSVWTSYKEAFAKKNITLKEVTSNPVDVVWTDQPDPPMTNVSALALKFAGKTWQEKIEDLRKKFDENGAKAFIVTSLDETAWLFNLRASDIEYNPFFLSYAIVEVDRIRLYILDKDRRLAMDPADNETVSRLHEHLNTRVDGQCAPGTARNCVQVLDYNQTALVEDVRNLAAEDDHKIWVTYVCNYAIYSAIPDEKRFMARSSIALDKAQKNPVERQGMENCYNRDSAVLIEFLAMLEKEVKEGKRWTEVSAARRLKEMREAAQYNRGLSFPSISSSGPNGAIIHYRPADETDRNITTQDMYLLDSGGQYLDGTTDVTRTMHYGTPTAYEKECYTRVFMGQTDLALMIWPEGLYGREIDMAARAPLWSVGLEYRHGTGHGIGAYLSVHEGPGRISLTHARNPSEETLHPYMYFSDEPGYYEPGKFGIRLETIVMVEPINTTYKFGDKQFMRFKPITLVPFEPDLIDINLLSPRQIEWLNNYNKRVWEVMSPRLSQLARDWTYKRTRPIEVEVDKSRTSTAMAPSITMATVVLAALIAVLF